MNTKYTSGEKEFNQYAKKHDKRLLGLYGAPLRLSNGDIIKITALTKRKCKYLVLGGYKHQPEYKFPVAYIAERLVDEDLRQHFIDQSNFVEYNANPSKHNVDDCSVRALSKALEITWDEAFMKLANKACSLHLMPNNESTIVSVLEEEGYSRKNTYAPLVEIVEKYPNCIACQASHMIAVVDGKYYDKSDTGTNIVSSIFIKE